MGDVGASVRRVMWHATRSLELHRHIPHTSQTVLGKRKKEKKSRFAVTHGIRMGLDRMEVKNRIRVGTTQNGGGNATLFAERKKERKPEKRREG